MCCHLNSSKKPSTNTDVKNFRRSKIIIIIIIISGTNCNWQNQYSNQRIGTGTGGLGNKRTSGHHPNYSIVEISQNTKKSPGDLRKTCCHSSLTPANVGMKNS